MHAHMHSCVWWAGGIELFRRPVEIVGSNNRRVGCGLNNSTRPVEPLGWVGGFGDQTIRGVDAGRVRYPLTEGTGSDVCISTPHIYVQFYIYIYVYIYALVPLITCHIFQTGT